MSNDVNDAIELPLGLAAQIRYFLCLNSSDPILPDHIARLYDLSLRACWYEDQMNVYPDFQDDWARRLQRVKTADGILRIFPSRRVSRVDQS